MVEGVTIEGRRYDSTEYNALSPSQKAAVVRLHRKAQGKKPTAKRRGNSVAPKDIAAVTHDDLVTLGEAIVSGVTQASTADDDTASTITNPQQSPPSNGTATSGSIGDYLRRSKRVKKTETKGKEV